MRSTAAWNYAGASANVNVMMKDVGSGTDEKKARHASHATGGDSEGLDLVGEACEGGATFILFLSRRSRCPYGQELAHQEGMGQPTFTKPKRPAMCAVPLCITSPPLLKILALFSRHGKYNSGERKV